MRKIMLIAGFVLLLSSVGSEASAWTYSRDPVGDPVISPVTYHIQGVFGSDFCEGTYGGNYFSRYLINASTGLPGGNVYSAYMPHAQGEVVDEYVALNLSPGTYQVRLYCSNEMTGQSGPIVYELDNPLYVVENLPVILSNPVLPPTSVGHSYSATISVSGGVTPYNFSVISGSLPAGLILNSGSGIISGISTIAGTFNLTIQVMDSGSATDSKTFTLTVAPSSAGFIHSRDPVGDPVISPVTYHIQGVFGSDFCEGTYGGNYFSRYLINASTGLPGGNVYSAYMPHAQGEVVDEYVALNLSPGTYQVRLYCSNEMTGQSGPIVYELDNPLYVVAIIITTTTLSDASTGIAYSQNLTSLGGTQPIAWNIVSGALPTGLILGSNGIIYGTPTMVQASNFTIQATDINNQADTQDLSIVVHGNTPVGSNIQVATSSTTLTFSNVTQEGQTTVTTSSGGQPPPTGFKLGNPATYYSISTTATFTGAVQVCIYWTQGQFNNENNLKLFHSDGTNWTNITNPGYPDTVNNIICGTTTSFSDFAIFEKKQVVAQIDIKPGSYPNTINLGSNGTVPIAILSTVTFDATTVDPLTVTLASAPVQLRGSGTAMYSFQDVNNDGLQDLIVHINTEALQLSSMDQTANLVGYTSDDTEVIGSDTVRVIQ